MIIGSHVSFNKDKGLLGSTLDALSYDANTFMFYTGAPQNTVRKVIDLDITKRAIDLMNENNICIDNVICHAPYIINLATGKKEQWDFSINFLKEEINRCKLLQVKKIVVHPGNAVGILKSDALDNLVNALKILVNEEVTILIETMAGKGTEICSNLEEIAYIFEKIDSKYLGVCLDTCHLNDSGVDVSKFDNYLGEFEKVIGLDKIGCIHINDSKNDIGMKKDRHENFGYGKLGFNTLIDVIYNDKLKDVPKILETPFIPYENTSFPPYKFEIEMIKNKKFNPNLLEDIINFYK